MALSQNTPATDSAAHLREIIGSDSTATFEDDPSFIDSDATATGSSENLSAAKDDPEEDEDDLDEVDDDGELEEDDGEDDEEEVDEEDDEEDEEDYDDDDDDDEEEEDDADEVAASSASNPATLRADGLLGYEDEADDVQKGLTEKQGDAQRAKQEAALKDGEDDDAADDGREAAVDEDKLNEDDEIDLDGDDAALDTEETATIRKGLQMLTAADAAVRFVPAGLR